MTKDEGHYVHRANVKHSCEPPPSLGNADDWVLEDGRMIPKLREGVRLPHIGDIWECDTCGQTWTFAEQATHRYYAAPRWEPEGWFARWWREFWSRYE